jgi:hypothetical protein
LIDSPKPTNALGFSAHVFSLQFCACIAKHTPIFTSPLCKKKYDSIYVRDSGTYGLKIIIKIVSTNNIMYISLINIPSKKIISLINIVFIFFKWRKY